MVRSLNCVCLVFLVPVNRSCLLRCQLGSSWFWACVTWLGIVLLVPLLFQFILPLLNATIAVLTLLLSFPLQYFHAKTSMNGIVASEVAIREPPTDLVTASVGDSLKVAHNEAVSFEENRVRVPELVQSVCLSKNYEWLELPGPFSSMRNCTVRIGFKKDRVAT